MPQFTGLCPSWQSGTGILSCPAQPRRKAGAHRCAAWPAFPQPHIHDATPSSTGKLGGRLGRAEKSAGLGSQLCHLVPLCKLRRWGPSLGAAEVGVGSSVCSIRKPRPTGYGTAPAGLDFSLRAQSYRWLGCPSPTVPGVEGSGSSSPRTSRRAPSCFPTFQEPFPPPPLPGELRPFLPILA